MRFKRKKRSETARWLLVAGIAVTGAAAAYAISRLLRSAPVKRHRELVGLEKQVLQALLNDEVAAQQAIEVSAVGAGVIELSGMVETEEQARRVIAVIDGAPGVHGLLNRLTIGTEEDRLRRNRTKHGKDESVRWYGGSVGIGKRRQSYATDPARRDDSAAIRSKALQPNLGDVLTDVEEMEGNGVRISTTNSSAFATRVPPRSPDPAKDEPGPPPAAETT